MNRMEQAERDYRGALDGLRFSRQAKTRMAQALAEGQEKRPVKGKHLRPLRAGLIAAALCAALMGTAGAAAFAARQAHIQYMDREQFKQEYNQYLEEHGQSPNNYSDNHYTGRDFTWMDAEYQASWWEGPDGELVEDAAGSPEDGWEAKRVFQYWEDSRSHAPLHGKVCRETRYRAELVSGFGGLWDCWDMSWLEEHYDTNPYGVWARTLASRNGTDFVALGGEFRRDDGAWFNVTYSWDGCHVYGDEVRAAGNKQYSELYTTPDGVEVAIEMDTSETGKSVFWVHLSGGHSSFSMHGTQVGLDDLHQILDSLNLSKLLEFDPVG